MHLNGFKQMILHIPHSSTHIPKKYAAIFPNQALLESELLCMTDHYTHNLFYAPCQRLIFPLSRLICDVERFRSRQEEPMSAVGMWVCYDQASTGATLTSFGKAHEQEILQRWYDPHHTRLTALTDKRLKMYGGALIVDCHSFSPDPLPHEPSQSPCRPDFCIGTDPFHTPSLLAASATNFLHKHGYTVAYNTPFAGTMVPITFLGLDTRVHSIMIEVNRSLYLDVETGFPGPGYLHTQAILAELLDLLSSVQATLSDYRQTKEED